MSTSLIGVSPEEWRSGHKGGTGPSDPELGFRAGMGFLGDTGVSSQRRRHPSLVQETRSQRDGHFTLTPGPTTRFVFLVGTQEFLPTASESGSGLESPRPTTHRVGVLSTSLSCSTLHPRPYTPSQPDQDPETSLVSHLIVPEGTSRRRG